MYYHGRSIFSCDQPCLLSARGGTWSPIVVVCHLGPSYSPRARLVRFEYLLPPGAYMHHIVVVLGGTCSLARSHQLHLCFGRHRCTWGNEVRKVLAKSSIVKIAGSGRERTSRRPTCAWERPEGYLWSYPTESLALARGSNGDYRELWAFWYLGKNIRDLV
jgi:hypothetical protein